MCKEVTALDVCDVKLAKSEARRVLRCPHCGHRENQQSWLSTVLHCAMCNLYAPDVMGKNEEGQFDRVETPEFDRLVQLADRTKQKASRKKNHNIAGLVNELVKHISLPDRIPYMAGQNQHLISSH